MALVLCLLVFKWAAVVHWEQKLLLDSHTRCGTVFEWEDVWKGKQYNCCKE